MMEEQIPELCEICSEPMDRTNNAVCHSCGRFFHLKWDTRLDTKDCGGFAIDELSMALFFTCHTCLGSESAKGA